MKEMKITFGPWTVGFSIVLSTILVGIFNAFLCIMFFTMDLIYLCYVLDEYRKEKNKNNKEKNEELDEKTNEIK